MNTVRPEPREGFRPIVIAENQPRYEPLYANHSGRVVELKFELTPEELAQLASSGVLYLSVMTFGQPLQPVLLTTARIDDDTMREITTDG